MKKIFLLWGLFACIAALALSSYAQKIPKQTLDSLQTALDKIDAAQVEFHNGHPEAMKALWSHANDVTLAGGAGGPIEKAWDNVGKRLDWASSHYEKAVQTNERIAMNVFGDVAYVVQYEHIRFHVPGQAKESRRDYRITMVFRRESVEWRILHRQADTQVAAEVPK